MDAPQMTQDLTPEAVAKMLEGVTPGPWIVEYKYGTTRLMMGDSCQMCDETYYPWTPDNLKDWHFIAWAREAVPALAAERDEWKARATAAETKLTHTITAWGNDALRVEELEAEVARLRDYLSSCVAMIQHAIGEGKDVFIEPDTKRRLSDARAAIQPKETDHGK
jgi:hypothetical protein